MKRESDRVKVLCADCSEFFMTSPDELECAYWNVCLSCLRKEGERTRKVLAERGVVLPGVR